MREITETKEMFETVEGSEEDVKADLHSKSDATAETKQCHNWKHNSMAITKKENSMSPLFLIIEP